MLAVNINRFVTEVSLVVAQSQKKSKAAPKCRACKKTMKGHKFVTDCPRNERSTS
jgi:hypothetical protein